MAYKPVIDQGGYGTTPQQQQQTSFRILSSPGAAPSVPATPDIGTTQWVDRLKSSVGSTAVKTTPAMPAPINPANYQTNPTTIADLSKKYGFDYSRDYAKNQAQVRHQGQIDSITGQRERLEHETESAKTDLQHDYFKKFLQQRQGMADVGINAGIASERNLRLDMSRQNALGDILANSQLRHQDLDRQLATGAKEAIAYEEQLYNERLQQAFQNSMDYSRFQQSENQWRAGMDAQQRQQTVDERWRSHEWNNMSYAQKQKMIVDAEKYGMDKAWEMHKFEAGMAFEAGMQGGVPGGANFTQFKVSSPYGTRNDPFTGKPTQHRGVDFATPMNTPIGATVGGTVIHAGYTDGGFGNYVAVKDANGLVHIYGHLNGVNVKKGDKVSPGQIVGPSGNSGRSKGAHLHYEVRRDSIGGSSIDPMPFLKG